MKMSCYYCQSLKDYINLSSSPSSWAQKRYTNKACKNFDFMPSNDYDGHLNTCIFQLNHAKRGFRFRVSYMDGNLGACNGKVHHFLFVT